MMSAPDFTRPLADLVAFPTISAVSNLDLVAYLEDLAAQVGGRVRRFPDPTGEKANLLLSVGPEVAGGIVLSGHTDVVPVDGQAWTGDPWTLRDTGERLIGRGATDMKGFLACCLAILPQAATASLKRPVHLAFSYDEEVGCTGVGPMAEFVGESLAPKLAVIGEATNMRLVDAHKGGCIGWTHVKGKPGHSSNPGLGVNAVMIAAELIAEINRIYEDMQKGPMFKGLTPPHSTIQVNQVQGGSHGNIIAEDAKFFWEMRLVPGQKDSDVLDRMQAKARALEKAMKAVDPATGIRLDIQARIPALVPAVDPALQSQLLKLLGQERPEAVSYGTEAGIFANAGTPAVVVGPGDIRDAHQPDEAIDIAQMAACCDFLLALTDTLTR